MQRRKPNAVVLAVALLVHAVFVAITWRDLSRRPATGIRGPRALWRVVSGANTLGAVAYWMIGRRRTEPVTS
jgi:hypothetical protein